MNLFRLPRIATLVLTALTALIPGAHLSATQLSRGEFTLPLETHWASAVMAPGSYSYTLDRASSGFVLLIRGQGKLVMIPAVGTISLDAPFKGSTMLLVTEGQQTSVRSMQFGHLGLTLRYGSTKVGDKSGSVRKESHIKL